MCSIFDPTGWPWRSLYEEAGYIASEERMSKRRRIYRTDLEKIITLFKHGMFEQAFDAVQTIPDEIINMKIGSRTLLMHACANPQATKSAAMLIMRGADARIESNDHQTALHFAARYGHIDAVRCLIRDSYLINRRDIRGRTALLVACTYRQYHAAMCLLRADHVDMFLSDFSLKTPLHAAAVSDCMLHVSRAIGRAIPFASRARNADGETPLDIARKHHALKQERFLSLLCELDTIPPVIATAYDGKDCIRIIQPFSVSLKEISTTRRKILRLYRVLSTIHDTALFSEFIHSASHDICVDARRLSLSHDDSSVIKAGILVSHMRLLFLFSRCAFYFISSNQPIPWFDQLYFLNISL